MNKTPLSVLSIAICFVAVVIPALAQDTTRGHEIYTQIRELDIPRFDSTRSSDKEYRAAYSKDFAAAQKVKAELTLKLFKADPTHIMVPKLMPLRWQTLNRDEGNAALLLEETKAVMETTEGTLAIEAGFMHAVVVGAETRYAQSEFMPALDRFIASAPEDDRAAQLLMAAARYYDTDQRLATYKRALEGYPKSKYTRGAPGMIRQIEGIGKPFELKFNDALTGETVSIEGLRGKVVVLDFWATWCVPCVKEIPHLKELYAAYSDKGVEFIGVSLDQPEDKGGLEKLRAYCDENEIAWPQYYQGNFWQSKFSSSWGINAIPAMFVIDQKGNLKSTNARHTLDDMLPEMLGIEGPAKDDSGGG